MSATTETINGTALTLDPAAKAKRKQERTAEATAAFVPLVEQAFKTLGLEPARALVEATAAAAAAGFTPDEENAATDVSRLLAHATATVYATVGKPLPASPGRMEAELLATGEPVIAPGRGGEGERQLTPDEMREREAKAATWAREIWQTVGNEKAARFLEKLRTSAPMEVYNPEARVVTVNGVRMPLAEGMLAAKLPGRLPGRQSAGPDGRPRWGCVAVAEALGEWGTARARERAHIKYAHNIVIHGDEDDDDRRVAAYEYGDLEVVGR